MNGFNFDILSIAFIQQIEGSQSEHRATVFNSPNHGLIDLVREIGSEEHNHTVSRTT